jgi:hypothetical protein
VNGNVIRCTDPGVMAALRVLEGRRPEFVPVQELWACASDAAVGGASLANGAGVPDADAPAGEFQRFLRAALVAGAIEAVLSPPRVTRKISQRPVVGPLARVQAQRGGCISSQLREPVRLSSVSRFIAGLLDGTRGYDQIVQGLRQAIDAGTVAPDPFEHGENDAELVRNVLASHGRAGLLIA